MDDGSVLRLRVADRSDLPGVVAALDGWWDGRALESCSALVSLLGGAPTSFVLESDAALLGFVLAECSRAALDELDIRLIGVHPACRRLGHGRRLCERVFAAARLHGRSWVRSSAPLVDATALAFHARLGFVAERAGASGLLVFHRRVLPDVWPGTAELGMTAARALVGRPAAAPACGG